MGIKIGPYNKGGNLQALLFCYHPAPIKQLSLGIPNILFFPGVITFGSQ